MRRSTASTPRGRMDLIADFAFRLPVTVICDMLGIPEEDREMFFAGARAGGRLLDPVPLSRAEIDEQMPATWRRPSISAAVRAAPAPARRRSHHPAGSGRGGGHKLTNEELTANVILLFGAGHETTVNLIGNGLLALHRNPDQLRLLRSDPSLIANAVEEFLRYDSSVQVTGRTALEDVDGSAASRWPRAQSVLCLLGAANRDPAVYPDPIGSTSPAPTSARCRSAAASISASAPSSPASRARSRSPRCCAACRTCSSTTSSIPIGGRRSSCAA